MSSKTQPGKFISHNHKGQGLTLRLAPKDNPLNDTKSDEIKKIKKKTVTE